MRRPPKQRQATHIYLFFRGVDFSTGWHRVGEAEARFSSNQTEPKRLVTPMILELIALKAAFENVS